MQKNLRFDKLNTRWKKSRFRRLVSRFIDSRHFPKMYREKIGDLEIGMLKRLHVYPIATRKVPIKDLYVQFRSEWPIQKKTSNPKAKSPLRLLDSPFFDFAKAYATEGRKLFNSDLTKLSFYQFWKKIDSVGSRYDWYDYPNKFKKNYPSDTIIQKINEFANLFDSIQELGFQQGSFSKRAVSVFETPFENTHFGFEHQMKGYEIWSGHHRIACLAALGEEKVEAVILEDHKNGI